MSNRRYRDPSPDRGRYYEDGGLPLNEGEHQYYPRFYPAWTWNPYTAGTHDPYRAADQDLYVAGDQDMSKNASQYAQGGRWYPIGDDGRRLEGGHYAAPVYDNPGYVTYGQGSMGRGSYKLKPASAYSGDDNYPGEGQRASGRRCCVVLTVVGVVLLIAAGIAIGVYFGVVDKPERIPDTTTPAPSAMAVEVTLTSNEQWSDELYDPGSAAYRALATQAKQETDAAFQGSDIASAYTGSEVTGFKEGSIIMSLALFFSKSSVPSGNTVVQVTQTGVQNILKTKIQASSTSFAQQIVANQIQATVVSVKGRKDLGDSCQANSDCEDADSECSTSVCTCKSGFYNPNPNNNGGVCKTATAYGGACSLSRECDTTNAACIGQVCTCNAGDYFQNNRCFAKLGYETGTGCTNAALQCLTKDAVCSATSQCTCSSATHYRDGDQCRTKIVYGGSCNLATQCKTSGAVCTSSKCGCDTTTTRYIQASDQCKALVDNGVTCTETDDCKVGGAVCNAQKVCACTSTQYADNAQCRDKRPFGSLCSSTDQCGPSGSICLKYTCLCPVGTYRQGDNWCTDKKDIGESCASVMECRYTNAICDNNVCSCGSTDYKDTATKSCLNKAAYNGPCTAKENCLTVNAECENSKCLCGSGNYYDGTSTCFPKIENGNQCGNKAQCKLGNSVCETAPGASFSTCQCPAGTYTGSATCETTKAYGSACAVQAECRTENSVCDSNCKCHTDRYFSSDLDSCIQKVAIGGTCTTADQCVTADAVCRSSDMTCQCTDGKFSNGTACVSKGGVGSPCTTKQQCEFPRMECEAGTCQCVGDTYPGDTDCLDKKPLNSPCSDVKECKHEFAICNTNCLCPQGRFDDGTKCEQQSDNGEICSVGMAEKQCLYEKAECFSAKCRCPLSTFEADGNICEDKIDINQSGCKEDGHCLWNNATCDSLDTCVCAPSTYESAQDKACLPKKPNESPCTEDKECGVVSGAKCLTVGAEKKCGCEGGYALQNVCRLFSAYGGSCQAADHCSTRFAQCLGDKCLCAEGSFHNEAQDLCSEKAGQNATCTDVSECSTGSAICAQNLCTCDVDWYYDDSNGNDNCEPKVDNGEACMKDAACKVPNAYCLASLCDCADDSYFKDGSCNKKKELGLFCETLEECLYGNAICDDSACACPLGTFPADLECKAKAQNGEYCEITDHCQVEGAQCLSNVCNCTLSYYLLDQKCEPKVANGQPCSDSAKCNVTGATCDIFCACPTGTYEADGACNAHQDYGEPCTSDVMCKTQTCDAGFCSCLSTFYYDQTLQICSLKKFIGEACSDTTQCMAGESNCMATCQCKAGTYYGNLGNCEPKKGYMELCAGDDECGLDGGYCGEYCRCNNNEYHKDGKCWNKIVIGGVCEETGYCLLGGSTCDGSLCKCPGKTYATDTDCVPVKDYGESCSKAEECFSNVCLNTRCDCADTDYYDGVSSCQPMVGKGEACTMDAQCGLEFGVCIKDPGASTGICDCDATRTHFNGACIELVGDGVACVSDGQCSYDKSVCTANTCTCPPGTYVNHTGSGSCDDQKPIGGSCLTVKECSTPFAWCNIQNQCGCKSTDFFDGTNCSPKRDNGASCVGAVEECKVDGAVCDTTCKCPAGQHLPDGDSLCVQNKAHGETCSNTEPCATPFQCTDSVCSCPSGQGYVGTECITTTTTTTMPTTTLPPIEEDIPVEFEGEVTVNSTYIDAYNDTSSPEYQALVASVEESLGSEMNGTTVKVTGVEQGSIKFILIIIVNNIGDEKESEEDIKNNEITLAKKGQDMLIMAVISLKEKKVELFKEAIEAKTAVTKVTQDSCLDPVVLEKQAEKPLCLKLLDSIRRMDQNQGKTLCRTYKDLLDCVALNLMGSGHQCTSWSKMKGAFQKILRALKPAKDVNRLKSCAADWSFQHTDQLNLARPCVDSTTIALTLPYVGEASLKCSTVDQVSSLTASALIGEYSATIDTCTTDHYDEIKAQVMAVMLLDSFQLKLDINLKTCQFCRAKNLMHVFDKHCGKSSVHTKYQERFCSSFMMEMQCLAAHTLEWTPPCGVDKIVEIATGDEDFLQHVATKADLRVPDGGCPDTPLVSYGPATTSLAEDQSYLMYLLTYSNCAMPAQGVDTTCLYLVDTARCLAKYLKNEADVEISEEDMMQVLTVKPQDATQMYLVDAFPGIAGCWEAYQQDTTDKRCALLFMENKENLAEKCNIDLSKKLAAAMAGIDGGLCGLKDALILCMYREDRTLREECTLQSIDSVARQELSNRLDVESTADQCTPFEEGITLQEASCRNELDILAGAIGKCSYHLRGQGCGPYKKFRDCTLIAMAETCEDIRPLDIYRRYLIEIQSALDINLNCIELHDSIGRCPDIPFDTSSECSDQWYGEYCSSDNQCGGDDGDGSSHKFCCRLPCSYQCIDLAPRPDRCPVTAQSDTCLGTEVDSCSFDDMCGDGQKCCKNGCDVNECQAVEVEGPCQLDGDVINTMQPCVSELMEQQNGWRVCSLAEHVANCVAEASEGNCPAEAALTALSDSTEAIRDFIATSASDLDQRERLNWLTLARFDKDKCMATDYFDVNPCDSCQSFEKAYQTCMSTEIDQDRGVFDTSDEVELCSNVNHFMECMVHSLQEDQGARCYNLVYNVKRHLSARLMDEYDLTQDRLNKCNESFSVCSYTFMFSANNPCHVPDGDMIPTLDCSSDDFKHYMICTMLMAAYRKETTCTAEKYLDLLKNAPYPVLFSADSDLDVCLGADFKSELSDLCTSPSMVNSALLNCEDHMEPTQCSEPLYGYPEESKCSLFNMKMSCVQKMLPSCTAQQITSAFSEEKSDTIVQGITQASKDCAGVEENQCAKMLMTRYGDMRKCIHFMHNLTWEEDQNMKCGMLSEVLLCLEEFAFNEFPEPIICQPSELKQVAVNVLLAEVHQYLAGHCMFEEQTLADTTSQIGLLNTCPDTVGSKDMCTNEEKLAQFIIYACPMGDYGYYDKGCSQFRQVVDCSVNQTEMIGYSCSRQQVSMAIKNHAELIDEAMLNIFTYDCLRDVDYMVDMNRQDVVDALNTCLPDSLIKHLVGMEMHTIKCSTYKQVFGCLSKKLGGECEMADRQIHMMMEERFYNKVRMMGAHNDMMFEPYCQDDEDEQLCQHPEQVLDLAQHCVPKLKEVKVIEDEEECPGLKDVEECIDGVVRLYGTYDCLNEITRKETVKKAIIIQATRSHLINLLSCYTDSDARCPSVGDKWSCGNRQNNVPQCSLASDCMPGQICCLKGCTLTCVDPQNTAAEKDEFQLHIRLLNEFKYSPDHENLESAASKALLLRNSEQFGALGKGLNFRVTEILNEIPLVVKVTITRPQGGKIIDVEKVIWDRMEQFKCSMSLSNFETVSTGERDEMCTRMVNGSMPCDDGQDCACYGEKQCASDASCRPWERCCGPSYCGTCHAVEDACDDPGFITDMAILCINDSIRYSLQHREEYELCSVMDELIGCVSGYSKEQQWCSREMIQEIFETKKEYMGKRLKAAALPFNPRKAQKYIQRYNREECNKTYYQYPCSNGELLEATYDQCMSEADITTGFTSDCTLYNGLQDCMIKAFSDYGVNCYWDIESFMHRELYGWFNEDSRDDMNTTTDSDMGDDPQIPLEEFRDKCNGERLLCSHMGLQDLQSRCFNGYIRSKNDYGYRVGSCSNSSDAMALKDYMVCARLAALQQGQPECTAERFAKLLRDDPRHGSLFASTEDLDTCELGDISESLDAELASSDSVCTSPRAIEFMHGMCNTSKTCKNYKSVAEPTLACWVFLTSVDCVISNFKNMSFPCEMDDFMYRTQFSEESFFSLPQATMDQCDAIQASDDFTCQKNLTSLGNESVPCFSHLYTDLSDQTADVQCRLYDMSVGCMEGLRLSKSAKCTAQQMEDFLPTLVKVSQLAYGKMDCCSDDPYTSTIGELADTCSQLDPPENLCDVTDETTKKALKFVVESGCSKEAKDNQKMLRYMTGVLNQTTVPHDSLVCLGLQAQRVCAFNHTLGLGLDCLKSDVAGLISETDLLKQNTEHCKGCFEETKNYTKCFNRGIIENIQYPSSSNKTLRCRLYNYLRKCAMTNLGDSCTNKQKETRIQFSLMQRMYDPMNYETYFYSKCPPAADIGPICESVEELAKVASDSCDHHFWEIKNDCQLVPDLEECFGQIYDVFGDCGANADRAEIIKTAIVIAVRNYGSPDIRAIEECLNIETRAGDCPIYKAMTNVYCGQNWPSDCVFDDHCSSSPTKKCCPSGCKSYTCNEPATAPVTLYLWLALIREEYVEGIEDEGSAAADEMADKYNTRVDDFVNYLGGVPNSADIVAFKRVDHDYNRVRMRIYLETFNLISQEQIWAALRDEFDMVFEFNGDWTVFPAGNITDKEGECPKVSFGHDTTNPCNFDVDCFGDKKCCGRQWYSKSCTNPGPVLQSCQETEYLSKHLTMCDTDINEVADFICGSYLQTANCLHDKMNRPTFYECTLEDLAYTTRNLLAENDKVLTHEDLFDCRELQLQLVLNDDETQECDAMEVYREKSQEILGRVFTPPSDYPALPGMKSCISGSYEFEYTVYTTNSSWDVESALSYVFSMGMDISGEYKVHEIDDEIDRCRDEGSIMTVIEESDCVQQAESSGNTDSCSIVSKLKDCMVDSIYEATHYQQHCHDRLNAFAKPEMKQNIADLIDPVRFPIIAEAVLDYDYRKCEGDSGMCWHTEIYYEPLEKNCDSQVRALDGMTVWEQCGSGLEALIDCLESGFEEQQGRYCSRPVIKDMLKNNWYSFQYKFEAEWPQQFDPNGCDRTYMYEAVIKFSDLPWESPLSNLFSPETEAFIQNNIWPLLEDIFQDTDFEITGLWEFQPDEPNGARKKRQATGGVMVGVNFEAKPGIQEVVEKRIEEYTSLSLEKIDIIEASDLVCFRPNFNNSFHDYCRNSWEPYNKTDDCWHLQSFILCMKYNAWARGQRCSLVRLYPQLKKYVKERSNRTYSGHDSWNTTSATATASDYEWGNVSMNLCTCRAEFMTELGNLTLTTNRTRDTASVQMKLADLPDQNLIGFGISRAGENTAAAYMFPAAAALPDTENTLFRGSVMDGEFDLFDEPTMGPPRVHAYREQYFNVYSFETKKDTWVDGNSFAGEVNINIYRGSREAFGQITLVDSMAVSEGAVDLSCDTSDADYLATLEADFSEQSQDMCRSWRAHRYFLEYDCFNYIPTLTSDDLSVLNIYCPICVLEKLQETMAHTGLEMCTSDTVEATLSNPEVTYGLLDIVDKEYYDVFVSTLDQCSLELLYGVTDDSMGTCLAAPSYLGALTGFLDVEDVSNADNTTSLACSVFSDTIQCLSSNIDSPACQPQDYTVIASHIVNLGQKYMLAEFPKEYQMLLKPQIIEFRDICTVDDIREAECPGTRHLADNLVPFCGLRLYLGAQYSDMCRVGPPALQGCADEYLSSMKERRWPDGCNIDLEPIKEQTFDEYNWFFETIFGFDTEYCSALSGCLMKFYQEHEDCGSPFSMLHYSYALNKTEACGIRAYVKDASRKCLEGKDNFKEECQGVLDDILDTRVQDTLLYLNNTATAIFDNCDNYMDKCKSYGAVTFVKCLFENAWDACATMDCLTRNPAPQECGFQNDFEVAQMTGRKLNITWLYCYEHQQFVANGTVEGYSFIDAFNDLWSDETQALIEDLKPTFDSIFQSIPYNFTRFWKPNEQRSSRRKRQEMPEMLGFNVKFSGDQSDYENVRNRANNQPGLSMHTIKVDKSKPDDGQNPCTVGYYEQAKVDCDVEWRRLWDTHTNNTCENNEGFFGCVVFQARSRDYTCDVKLIYDYLSGKLKEEGKDFKLCGCETGDCDAYLETLNNYVWPVYREEICHNRAFFDHLLLKRCGYEGYDEMSDMDKCGTLSYWTEDCVYPTLQDAAGCTEGQVMDLLRERSQCEQPSKCEMDLVGMVHNSSCMKVLWNLGELMDSDMDLWNLPSVNQEELLTCSVLADQANCVYKNVSRYLDNQIDANCTKQTLVDVMKKTLNRRYPELYDSCDVDVELLTGTYSGCPTTDYLIRQLTARCSHVGLSYNYDPCMSYIMCKGTAKRDIAKLHVDSCPDINDRIEEVSTGQAFSDYSFFTTGINVTECLINADPCDEQWQWFIEHDSVKTLFSLARLYDTELEEMTMLDLETFPSSDGESTLLCRMLNNQTRSLVQSEQLGFTDECDVTSLTSFLERLILGSHANPNCPYDYDLIQTPYMGCPSLFSYTDAVVLQCGPKVYDNKLDQCRTAINCMAEEVGNMTFITEADNCDNGTWAMTKADYITNATFIKSLKRVSTLNFSECEDYEELDECVEEILSVTDCLKEAHTMAELSVNMNANELCGVRKNVSGSMLDCLLGDWTFPVQCLNESSVGAVIMKLLDRYGGPDLDVCDFTHTNTCEVHGMMTVVRCKSQHSPWDGCSLTDCLLNSTGLHNCSGDVGLLAYYKPEMELDDPMCYEERIFNATGTIDDKQFMADYADLHSPDTRVLVAEIKPKFEAVFGASFNFTGFFPHQMNEPGGGRQKRQIQSSLGFNGSFSGHPRSIATIRKTAKDMNITVHNIQPYHKKGGSSGQCEDIWQRYLDHFCLDALRNLENIIMMDYSEDWKAQGCRLLTNQTRCLIQKTDHEIPFTDECTILSLYHYIGMNTLPSINTRDCPVNSTLLLSPYEGCPRLRYFNESTVALCANEVRHIDWVLQDRCKTAKECIGKSKSELELLYGPTCDNFDSVVDEYEEDPGFIEYFNEKSSLNLIECRPGECGAGFFVQATDDNTCETTWEAFTGSRKCHDYYAFLMCVRFHYKVYGWDDCNIAAFDDSLYGQIPGHLGLPQCYNATVFAEIDRDFPMSLDAACTNQLLFGVLVEYHCTNDSSAVSGGQMCMSDVGSAVCIEGKLEETSNCTQEQVWATASTEHVINSGLLTPEGPMCSENYPCVMKMLEKWELLQNCTWTALQFLRLSNHDVNLRQPSPADPNTRFDCSVGKYMMQCARDIEDKFPSPLDPTCTTDDRYLAMRSLVKLYSEEDPPKVGAETFDDCTEPLEVLSPNTGCPSIEEFSFMVAAQCSSGIREMKNDSVDSACWSLLYCMNYTSDHYSSRCPQRDLEALKHGVLTNGSLAMRMMSSPSITNFKYNQQCSQYIYKPGMCPRQGDMSVCAPVCDHDYACTGDQKCCPMSCGHICTTPATSPPNEQPVRR